MRLFTISLCVVCLSAAACTDPGETTGVGAAAGGAVGAGLGAIIGSQVGDAGAGLAIGAAAGAGTGAAVANAFEAQEKAIQTQEEAIARQERLIAAQQGEITELRHRSQDPAPARGAIEPRRTASPLSQSEVLEADRLAMRRDAVANNIPSAAERRMAQPVEAPVVPPVRPETKAVVESPVAARGAYDWKSAERSAANPAPVKAIAAPPPPAPAPVEAKPAAFKAAAGDECGEADKEVQRAAQVGALADKLFHYRRALRLCPNNPAYHNSIGEVYVSLQRMNDAEFEFREALQLDPGYAPAQKNLRSVQASASGAGAE